MIIGKIRDDVEVPESGYGSFREATGGRPKLLLRWQIEQLDVGQSFAVVVPEGTDLKKARDRINGTQKNASKKSGSRFTVRKTGEREFTVWRIA